MNADKIAWQQWRFCLLVHSIGVSPVDGRQHEMWYYPFAFKCDKGQSPFIWNMRTVKQKTERTFDKKCFQRFGKN